MTMVVIYTVYDCILTPSELFSPGKQQVKSLKSIVGVLGLDNNSNSTKQQFYSSPCSLPNFCFFLT